MKKPPEDNSISSTAVLERSNCNFGTKWDKMALGGKSHWATFNHNADEDDNHHYHNSSFL